MCFTQENITHSQGDSINSVRTLSGKKSFNLPFDSIHKMFPAKHKWIQISNSMKPKALQPFQPSAV